LEVVLAETGGGDDVGANVVAACTVSVGVVAGDWCPWSGNWVHGSGVEISEDYGSPDVQLGLDLGGGVGAVADIIVDLHGEKVDRTLDVL